VPYLRLIDSVTQDVTEIRDAVARLGRSPDCRVVVGGPGAGVVSALHAELRYEDGVWRLADLRSRNGTYLNDRRLDAAVILGPGDVIGLGESGPRFEVAAVTEGPPLPPTLSERPRLPGGDRAYGITLLDSATGRRYEAAGVRIRIGRGQECEVQVAASVGTTVSRVHAELSVDPSGSLLVRDAGSTNGTWVNGERVTAPLPIRLGDRLTLGPGGPVLVVDGLGTAPQLAAARPAARQGAGGGRPSVARVVGHALAQARQARREGKRGSGAVFVRTVVAEGSPRWLVGVVMVLFLLLGGAVYGVYWLLSTRVAETTAAERSAEDSVRLVTRRLERDLEGARASAAPAALVESLRTQLGVAQARTAELRAALDRAQAALGAQLAAGEARRVAAQNEVQRLRDELAAAERRAPSAATLDSLRGAVASAEQQTRGLDAKIRAIRGTDFAAIAQQNQGAVGLITVSFGRDYYNGTGFVITADGYMLTNWHVVADSLHPRPDTIWVILADQSQARYADVIATSPERDIAVIKLRGYRGGYIAAVDWSGTKARQGEPAALIGYPAGAGFARLRTSVVRTSMSAGIISRATDDVIQFDGMTIGGSSGSPLFNASGEVIAIHRAGLAQAPGFALSVPTRHAVAIMPIPLRRELGIE
jgi:pSer/pThr/pTyr-binding forkhead associated (FHA) protein/S1-C subfamily serine protease